MITKRLLIAALVVAAGLTACGKDAVKPASSGDPAEIEESTTTTAAE